MSVNQQIAERLERIAQMLEITGGDKFRIIAYQRAARAIEESTIDLGTIASDRKALLAIDGIGPKMADKIAEFCTTGELAELKDLEGKIPPGLVNLLRIPGLGPKTASMLWKEAGVSDVAGLMRIIKDGSILNLPRMGEKAVEKIKAALTVYEQGQERVPLGRAMPIAERFLAHLRALPGVEQIAFTGSLRRWRDTIGDIDILVASKDPGPIGLAFRTMPGVTAVLAAGDTKSSVRALIKLPGHPLPPFDGNAATAPTGPTVQVDLRVVPPDAWGAALMYFTGSKEHNVRLRERAIKRKMTLNEYGLFPDDKADKGDGTPPQRRGIRPVAARTEEDVYKALGLAYTPPEVREDRAEIERAAAGALPRLIEPADIKAELHAHTTASDGRLTIEELAAEAMRRGFHTIAVTDHSQSSVIAGGLKPDRLRAHINAVRAANERTAGITILAGSEVDILPDGRLDYDDDLLAELDIVVASPHASLTQDPDAATRRLLRAIENPLVHIIGHPTGRVVNRRGGLSPDMNQIIAAARQHNIALEINANWHRLDLRDTHVAMAVEAGVLIAIDCDAHTVEDFDELRYGVATGRRGWLTAEGCVNAWEAGRLRAWLKGKR